MKVFFAVHQFFPHYSSGTEQVVLKIASMLQKAGNKVKIAAYRVNPKGPVTGEFGGVCYNEMIYDQIPVLEYWLSSPPADLHFGLHFDLVTSFAEKVLAREKPDVVHLCHPMRSCGFLEAAENMGIPAVVTVTDLMFVCPKIIMKTTDGKLCTDARGGLECNYTCYDTGDNNQERMKYAGQLLGNALAVVAPSSFIKSMIESQFPKLDVRVLGHGLVIGGIARRYTPSLKAGYVTFGYVGTIAEHKGLHILIEAFLETKAKNIKLAIYGDWENPYGRRLKRAAELDERIEFKGRFNRDGQDAAYMSIDVLIIPSVCYESYSMVKYESVVRNIPLMVSCLGALPEQIDNGVNGFIFSPGATGELTRLIQSVAENPAILDEAKKSMSSINVSTIEQEAFEYLSLYRKCMSGREGRTVRDE